jgi:hypothetical protein
MVVYRQSLTWKKIFGLAQFGLGIGAFLFWKFLIQPTSYSDSKLSYLNTNITDLIERYLDGLKTILVGFQWPYPDGVSLPFLAGLALFMGISIFLLRSKINVLSIDSNSTAVISLTLVILGLCLWIAGYFPIILNFPINIYGHISRVNIFSLLGAALLISGAVDLISITLFRSISQFFTFGILLVLTAAGAVVGFQVETSYNQSWQETKDFYHALFREVPDIKPGTQLLINIRGYEDIDLPIRPIFTSNWEASCAIATLYNQPELFVDYQYTSIPVPIFPSNNILAGTLIKSTYPQISKPENLVAVEYDHKNHQVSLIAPPYLSERYAPQNRILPPGKVFIVRKFFE